MSILTTTRAMAGVLLFAGVLALSACSPAPDPTSTDDAEQDVQAGRFVACLNAQGQTAKIVDDSGLVGILLPVGVELAPPSEPGQGGVTMITKDADGEWVIASSSDAVPSEGGMSEAWATCEAEVPGFEQPQQETGIPDGEDEARVEAALAFAECARNNGYPEWPDPDDEGAMGFPDGLTEDGFLAVLEDCLDVENFHGLSVQRDVAETLDFDVREVLTNYLDSVGFTPGDGEGGGQDAPGSGGD